MQDTHTDHMSRLTEAVTRLAGWHYFKDEKIAPEMELYWAKKVCDLSREAHRKAETRMEKNKKDLSHIDT